MHRNTRRVMEAGEALGITVEPRQFEEGTRTAADAAAAIGVELGQIVKSLVFGADGEAVVALVPGHRRLDETKLAAAAGASTVERLDAGAVRAATGYPVGGVPPFGYPRPLRTFVDAGLVEFDEVWAAAGTPHCNFASSPKALVDATGAVVCDLAASGG